MPFVMTRLSSGTIVLSYRAEPGRAPRIWAASPTLMALASSECGPLVGRPHHGLEHLFPALLARASFVD